jgi:amino acid transporter
VKSANLEQHSPRADETPALRRTLSLPVLTFYGLGTIVGAGIYVLVGKVAGIAGLYTPAAFLLAAVAAFLTAFTYAEMSARFPKSAGEPLYVAEGLGVRRISILVGLMIVATGLVSSATIANGFVGYLHVFVDVPRSVAITVLVLALGALALWGIAESAWVATVTTVVEVGGLVLIIAVSGESLGTLGERAGELVPPLAPAAWGSIVLGAFLAFYAFIGFEDMVNVAEEVKDPVRNMPRAIFFATVAATTLYLLVALVAVLSLPIAELAASDAPLALLYTHATGRDPLAISVVSLFAVVNGALIQIIMAARVLYGMSRQGWIPAAFGKVHRRTRTPLAATLLVAASVLVLALAVPLVQLAKATSFVILVVFVLVHAALLNLKRRGIPAPAGAPVCPAWVPVAGILVSLALLAAQLAALM